MKQKLVLKLSGMDCSSCVINIDGVLEDADGIAEARTSYAKSQTEVVFDPEKMNSKKIIILLKEAGYDAAIVTP